MRFSSIAIAAATGLLALAAMPAQAVHVSSDGQGQVLIFPYYTVNGGHSTLLSVTNHVDRPKALTITIREARHGARVLAFNIYLGANDVWTAAIVPTGEGDAPAQIVTSDNTCTVPTLDAAGVPFRNFEYVVGDPSAIGPSSLARTREGFIEIIEAGELVDVVGMQPLPAASYANERNCTPLRTAWEIGPWGTVLASPINPSIGIASPTGGLSGNAILVDAANGSSFSYRATALQDFFRANSDCPGRCIGEDGENLHTLPVALSPNLASARNQDDGGSSAVFHRNGREYTFAFRGEGAGLKAVSAALMHQSLGNEFNARVTGNLDARSEWVLTMPTRGLHLGNTSAALRHPFNPSNTPLEGACENVGVGYWNRDAQPSTLMSIGTLRPNSSANLPKLCNSAQVWSFNQAGLPDGATTASSILGSALNHNLVTCTERTRSIPGGCSPAPTLFPEGRAEVLANAPHQFLFSSATPGTLNEGENVLLGLPVLGLWITSFESTGQPGVLANFTLQQPHVGQRKTASGFVTQSAIGSSWSEAGGTP